MKELVKSMCKVLTNDVIENVIEAWGCESMSLECTDPCPVLHKPGLVTLGWWKQEDPKFKVILGYGTRLRPV